MNLDANLRWKEHIKKKRDELNIKFKKMFELLGNNFELSVLSKFILYKQVIVQFGVNGIQLWGCASESNFQVIPPYQKCAKMCCQRTMVSSK
jgi:hypothetical protein